MPTTVLVALIAAVAAGQFALDRSRIVRLAARKGWSGIRVRWTPFGRGALTRSRWVRAYRLRYLDERGRPERRLCLVGDFLGLGGEGALDFEPASGDQGHARSLHSARGSRTGANRWVVGLACAGLGLFAGIALGIAGAFAVHPGSNIAPAYGVILGGFIGALGGALFGLLRGR